MEEQGLMRFDYLGKEVRTLVKNGEPWFVAADVCRILDISHVTEALKRLDDDEKMTLDLTEGHSGTRGGPQSWNIVNEPGLYSLVLGSRKKEAKAFKRWVVHDVLPDIRKHGAYLTTETMERVMNEPDFIIDLITAIKQEREMRMKLEEQNKLMAPKAEFCDSILQSPSLVATSTIAKDYGMTAQSFNKLLERHGIQYRLGGLWYLKKEYQDAGYMQSQTFQADYAPDAYVWNKWTQEGRKFLYEFLKERGILPLSERKKKSFAVGQTI